MLGVVARQEGALEARRLRLAWRNEQHVAIAEEHLSAGTVDDRAAVHLRRDTECDPARKVRLDQARDDVHARTLGRENEMYTRGARLLGEHGDGRLDLSLH